MSTINNGANARPVEQKSKHERAHMPQESNQGPQESNQGAKPEEPSEHCPRIFISHRHGDREIADILREFMLQATAARVKVFQSSFAGTAPEVGKILSEQLGDELYQAELVFLIYTIPDENWSYCMWECGVAFNPRKDDTKIVVLQCGKDVPAPLGDRIRVLLNDRTSVKAFVKQFLTEENFFPRAKKAITGFGPESADVEAWSDRLFEQLASVIVYEPDEAWHVWPYLLLELPLEPAAMIKQAFEEGREDVARDQLRTHCIVTENGENASQLFGKAGFKVAHPLDDLIVSWERKNKGNESLWATSLLNQLMAGAAWEFPAAEWAAFRHAQNQNLHVPMLLNVRKSPNKRCIQFGIYFPWFELDSGGAIQVNIPPAPGN